MKIYKQIKIRKLYESVEDHLTDEEKEIIKEILENYHKLIIYAKEKKEYIERKTDEYIKESDENEKLKLKVKDLNEKLERQKRITENFREELKNIKEVVNNGN